MTETERQPRKPRPLVARLRTWSAYTGSPLGDEAADEIERLLTLSQNNTTAWDALVRERDALREALTGR